MKVSMFMALVAFLIVGTNSSDPETYMDSEEWIDPCRQEVGWGIPWPRDNHVLVTDRNAWCLEACYLKRDGWMKDGKLVDLESLVNMMLMEDLNPAHSTVRAKGGLTARQLTEKCFERANLNTGECEVAGALVNCMRQETEDVRDIK